MRKQSVQMGVLSVGVALGAAACGGSGNGIASKTPSQIVAASISAMQAAKSAHIQGSLTQSGKKESLNLTLYSNGDVSGSLSEDSLTINIVKVGATDYIKTAASYYVSEGASASVAAQMGNHWVSLPDSQAGFGNQFSLKSFASQLKSNTGTLTAGSTSTVAGQSVVSVHSSKGGTVYVATTGQPYPVEFVGSSASSGTGSFSFSAWDASSAPSAPAGAKPASSFGQ